jgi:hypothetical protein
MLLAVLVGQVLWYFVMQVISKKVLVELSQVTAAAVLLIGSTPLHLLALSFTNLKEKSCHILQK